MVFCVITFDKGSSFCVYKDTWQLIFCIGLCFDDGCGGWCVCLVVILRFGA